MGRKEGVGSVESRMGTYITIYKIDADGNLLCGSGNSNSGSGT